MKIKKISELFFVAFIALTLKVQAADSTLSGIIQDTEQIRVGSAKISLRNSQGQKIQEVTSSITGDFQFVALDPGTYQIKALAAGFAPYESSVNVAAGANQFEIRLEGNGSEHEVVLNVHEKKVLVPIKSSGSQTEISKSQIESMPMGSDISLPKLLATTTPGIVQGPFGQMFVRGNHANVQYQIDGVQLPDSGSGAFGDSFSPRNIENMEIITGGIPAEYGERLAAVLNITTKSGPEKPGGDVELNYGSYNTMSPHATYGGSNAAGDLHYFLTLNYATTDRGLDTPQPASYEDQGRGGTQVVHDHSEKNEQFARVDYLPNNDDKFDVSVYNSHRFYQIPNFPAQFKPGDPYFQPGYKDHYGNQGADDGSGTGQTTTLFTYTPPNTNDTQTEQDSYLSTSWKHQLSDKSYFQLAPYMKYSLLKIGNDPVNDLSTQVGGANAIAQPNPPNDVIATSFALNRSTINYGLKGDYANRMGDHLLKAGFQAQRSDSHTSDLTIMTSLTAPPFQFSGNDHGNLGAVYVQDSYNVLSNVTLNYGLRYSETQFISQDINSSDGLLQPRAEVEYKPFEGTKLHAFYGKLYMPSPFENLREAFQATGAGSGAAYDLKAEKDDFYEIGISQQIAYQQVVTVNAYNKNAQNMIDDAQLLNTSIAQPYNFAKGYADGLEISMSGEIDAHWSDFINYSYEVAKGEGISGGIFAFTGPATSDYSYLDHVQVHTLNSGLSFKNKNDWYALQALYGSGLRTGPDNSSSLPAHLTFDWTMGYKFNDPGFWQNAKISLDILNLLDDAYPITIANGFNSNHYAEGRNYLLHLSKEF